MREKGIEDHGDRSEDWFYYCEYIVEIELNYRDPIS